METKKAWLLEVLYKNRAGQIVPLKEYHMTYQAAYNRLNVMNAKLQVTKASIKEEYNRGEA